MASTPSRLSEAHQTLVLDASVVINLLGSAQPERVLGVFARRPVLVVDIARDEVKRDPSNNKPATPTLMALESAELIKCVTLSEPAYGTFLDLVGAPAPDDLGDGEAATIAHAEEIKGTIVLDERKAQRIALARAAPRPVLSTLDLLSSTEIAEILPRVELADIVFASLRNARMRVPDLFRPWTIALIGTQRAAQCSALAVGGTAGQSARD
jgi:hypothetical protein